MGREDPLQFTVLHAHLFRSSAGDLLGLSHDQRQHVADRTHPFAHRYKHGLVGDNDAVGIVSRDVFGGKHRDDARHRLGHARVQGKQFGVGMFAEHSHCVQHPFTCGSRNKLRTPISAVAMRAGNLRYAVLTYYRPSHYVRISPKIQRDVRFTTQCRRRPLHGRDDRVIAGAATEVTGEPFTDIVFRGIGVPIK